MQTLSWLYKYAQTFLLAFLLAFVVWVSATTESDPNQEVVFRSVPLEIEGKEADTLIINQIPSQVSITMYAPSSRISLIERRISTISAKITLKGLTSGKYKIPVQISFNIQPARLVRLDPAVIAVEIEKIVEQVKPIKLQAFGKPALGYEAGKAELLVKEATITGAESQVNKVSELRAITNISGKEELIEEEIPVVAYDILGATVSAVEISPKIVPFHQQINLLKGYRNKVIRVVTVGELAEGYRLEDILVFPLKVLLFAADPELLDIMPGFVETEPLDLNQANKDLDTRLTLKFPVGISVVGDQTVRVRVRLSAIESSLALNLPLEVIGLDPQLTVNLPVDTVDVFLAGPLPILSNLQGKDVRVLIDLKDLNIGEHQVTPQVDILPTEVRMLSISPPSIDVIIQPHLRPSDTPLLIGTPEDQETHTITPKPSQKPKPSKTPTQIKE